MNLFSVLNAFIALIFSTLQGSIATDCVPYSESVCRKVALKHGLQLGGSNGGTDYPFVNTKDAGYEMGCYTYRKGDYQGMAFYGLGGDNDEMSKPFDYNSNYFRPKGYDCTIHEWNEYPGECRDTNSKTFDTWKIDRAYDGKIALDECKILCHDLEPCVACQCYDAGGYFDPNNRYCRVLTADDADPAVMNGLTLHHSKSAPFTSNSYPTKGNVNGGWNKLYTCHVKPLGPTCSDGAQNQNETGIDCGGPCDACPTCTDGIQNQGETGIDCGGTCSACRMYKFLHQGHCGGSGYISPNTNQESIDDCRKECESRPEVKYFAYKSGSMCSCYTTECTADGQNLDYMAFEILDSGALATFPTLEEETCSAESCGSTFRKFAKVSNAKSHELINNDLSDGGNVSHSSQCISICNERNQDGILKNQHGLYPCLGFNLRSLPGGNFNCELIGWSRYALFVGMLKYMYEEDDESTFYVIDSFEGECWVPARIGGRTDTWYNVWLRAIDENRKVKILGDPPLTEHEKTLVGNIRSPQDCQEACAKSWGCDYFMTKVHDIGNCNLLNSWALKQLIEMDYNSTNYWAQFRYEDNSEMVTLVGPKKCPDKKECWVPGHFQNPETYKNGFKPETDEWKENIKTIEGCQKECQKEDSCYFFTYSSDTEGDTDESFNCYFHGKEVLTMTNGARYQYQDGNFQYFGPKYC